MTDEAVTAGFLKSWHCREDVTPLSQGLRIAVWQSAWPVRQDGRARLATLSTKRWT